MARVFLAETENYVEVPDASVSLSDICTVFQVDPTSAYIRKSNSGAVVATLPTDSLPEFSGSQEYVLCAASSNIAGGTASSSNNHQQHHQGQGNGVGGDSSSDELQFTILRMAQLVDSLTGGIESGDEQQHRDEREAFASFLRESNQIGKKNASQRNRKLQQDHDQSKASSLLASVISTSNVDLMKPRDQAMFVSSEDHYHPETLKTLLNQMEKKQKNINAVKYSFS